MADPTSDPNSESSRPTDPAETTPADTAQPAELKASNHEPAPPPPEGPDDGPRRDDGSGRGSEPTNDSSPTADEKPVHSAHAAAKGRSDGDDEMPTRQGLPGWIIPVGLIALGLFFWSTMTGTRFGVEVPYGFVLEQIERENIKSAKLINNGHTIIGTWKAVPGPIPATSDDGKALTLKEKFNATVPVLESDYLLRKLEEADVQTEADEPSGATGAILLTFLPMIMLIGFFWFMMRRSADPMGPGGMFGKFGSSPARRFQADEKLATFDDVAGMDGPKQELAEIVEFLKTPQKFAALGAEIPKGVLMSGPPGTGKTLLGRSTAGEAGVPFFSINGSEFIQMFVGVGASRVRDMFKTARDAAPCILFIDEIDAIGRVRGAGVGGGHDEREQTLNQILSEMDGFNPSEAVIVIGATNRPDVLDPALLRPGRFDRKVEVDRPGKKGRIGILKVHTRKIPLADDVDLEEVASGTIGFSGAELKNLANEAALRAVRLDKKEVDQSDLLDAFEKVTLGVPRDEKFNEEDTRSTAYHEAGHALVAWSVPHVDPVFKVSIVPRGRTGGVMWSRPDEELMTQSEARLRGQMAVMMGGRAAEKLVFSELNSGASSDLQQATRIARLMVGKLGMSEVIGPVAFDQSEDHPFLGREMGEHSRKYSEETAHVMDQEVQRLLIEAEKRALDLLTEHREKLEALAEALLENEVVDREMLIEVIGEPAERTRGRAFELASQASSNGDGHEE